jgi:hypothetical protein
MPIRRRAENPQEQLTFASRDGGRPTCEAGNSAGTIRPPQVEHIVFIAPMVRVAASNRWQLAQRSPLTVSDIYSFPLVGESPI